MHVKIRFIFIHVFPFQVSVPSVREKADLSKYRDAGKEVIEVLLTFKGAVVERASVDEAYLDITSMVQERMESSRSRIEEDDIPNTYVVGVEDKDKFGEWLSEAAGDNRTDDLRLAAGAAIVEEMRKAVYEKTQFRCSAGVAHNKTLAKVACGLHKPNKQTVLPHGAVGDFFKTLKVTKLRGLGGKLGRILVDDLNCETVNDLAQVPLSGLRDRFEEKTAQWLHLLSRGEEREPVRERDLPKSIGCSKNFPGTRSLDTAEKVRYWFSQLAEEVCERLEKDREANGRVARGISVHLRTERGSNSKAGPLGSYDADKMTRQAMALVGSLNESAATDPALWRPRATCLSICATKFSEEDGQTKNIQVGWKVLSTSVFSFSVVSKLFQSFFANAASKTAQKEKEGGSDDKEDQEEDGQEQEVSVEELVPDLDSFDPSILELLPAKLRARAAKRVEELRSNRAAGEGTSRDNLVQVEKEDEKENAGETVSKQLPSMEEGAQELVSCEKCGKSVSPFELPEHLDFHMARELQRELSRQEAAASAPLVQQKTLDSAAGGKRKGKEASAVEANKKSKKTTHRDIASFFNKKA